MLWLEVAIAAGGAALVGSALIVLRSRKSERERIRRSEKRRLKDAEALREWEAMQASFK
jgi:hypothetical protein